MKYILQVFSGSWKTTNYRPEEIIQAIGRIASRIPVEKVIIGWSTDPSVYRETGRFLHESGIQMLLWLPVFAENGEISRQDEALDLFGNNIPLPAGNEGAGFRFGCFSSRNNIQTVKDNFEQYFSGCGFDGVFLDRIRSQSFASGVSGVLSCGCERCRKTFGNRGVDTGAVRELYERTGDSFFDVSSFPMNGAFRLKEPLAQRFFEAKGEIIAEAVHEITRFFQDRGMAVGLDLFAPAVSRFAGQNYSLIAKSTDFIKPMLYRRTDAPAGIGYEYSMLLRHLPGAEGWNPLPEDKALLETQLEAAGEVPCAVYPGIEINYDEQVVRTDAEYITESLAAIRDRGYEGAVLCWDVMRAPEEHIRAIQEIAAD